MSEKPEANVISLNSERKRRVHDLHEKRLQTVRAAFVQALPLSAVSTKKKKSKKKRR
ncbi:MAG TPA: hypothetical protein VFD11_03235 [Thiopseudomonas sp.]|nr:hypothetical protein [Thiopseudomonas sp.]